MSNTNKTESTPKITLNYATNWVWSADSKDYQEVIDTLARAATAGTLKRIYAASAHEQILQYMRDLQADFVLADNLINTEKLKTHFSDAYDIYLLAYNFLYEKIVTFGFTPNTTITKTLKNGKEKIKTVYQWSCTEVRKYIYNNKSIENNGKYVYIEDLKSSPDDTGENALDREYIRMGKYDGISTYHDYTSITDMLEKLTLSPQQIKILNMRLRGLSVGEIAIKFDVTQQTISKQLKRIQDKIKDDFPDMTRGFDFTHK